ncbi:MAG: type II toxin-antitoxin system RelE/ParE family toxin [Crocosphaera sp.]|nr:type II toxin-antitoxin system RelE/ParE family toxin [Crocosphaera sp.]
MSLYRIEFNKRVKKYFRSIKPQDVQRIKTAITQLSENPRPIGYKKLKGQNNDYYRIRVGNYRVIYTIEDNVLLIVVIRIGHRQEVYDKF